MSGILYDAIAKNNDDGTTLPLSASYLVGHDAMITFADLNANYREPTEMSDLLGAIQKISQGE